jgi:YggT family protein
MGGSYVGNAATFLIQTLFGLYILIVMLRFLLQWARADFYNPVSQFIVKATQPPLAPLRRIIPGLGGLDMAALLFMFVLKFVELWLVVELDGRSAPIGALAVLSVAGLLGLAIRVFMFSILIQVVISWVNPGMYNPLMGLLHLSLPRHDARGGAHPRPGDLHDGIVAPDPTPVRWDGENLILEIRLQPRASGNALLGIENGRLRIRVTAAPVDDAAKLGMMAILAKEFGVAKSRVRLLAGSRKRCGSLLSGGFAPEK